VSDTTTNGSSATFTFALRFWTEDPNGVMTSVMELEHMTISADGNVVAFEHSVLNCS
jgi:hypothetical protein